MNKKTINPLFLVYYFVLIYFTQTICKSVWLTTISFLIIISFIIFTIIKKESKKDYVSLTLGLCAIVYQTFCLIHYN